MYCILFEMSLETVLQSYESSVGTFSDGQREKNRDTEESGDSPPHAYRAVSD